MSLKCYVVDDMEANVELIARYVTETSGLDLVGTAKNPLIALEDINRMRPDIVFTDINMPQMSGITLAGLIDDFVQVVFISGDFQSSYPSVDWKNYFYLKKVITYKAFLDIISQIKLRYDN